jgi:probable phosphoglycerate mutase
MARGLQRLREAHDGQTMLLVSHGLVVRCMRHLIDGVSEADFFDVERVPDGAFLSRQLL